MHMNKLHMYWRCMYRKVVRSFR